jgi:hypothetical protein
MHYNKNIFKFWKFLSLSFCNSEILKLFVGYSSRTWNVVAELERRNILNGIQRLVFILCCSIATTN